MFSKPSPIVGIIILAFSLALGVSLVLVACLVWMEWWPALVVLAFLLAPLPNSLFSRCGDEYDAQARSWLDVGHFLTGAIIAAGVGIPIILTHVGEINVAQFFLSLAGGLIIYVSFELYIYFYHGQEEESEF